MRHLPLPLLPCPPQVAGLVREQGETLQRIEDDIESGLQQTEQVHLLRGAYAAAVLCPCSVLSYQPLAFLLLAPTGPC